MAGGRRNRLRVPRLTHSLSQLTACLADSRGEAQRQGAPAPLSTPPKRGAGARGVRVVEQHAAVEGHEQNTRQRGQQHVGQSPTRAPLPAASRCT